MALTVKNLPTIVGDPGSVPGQGKSLWRREWQPIPVRLPRESHGWTGAWWATVYGVTKSQTRLSD